VKPQTHTHTRLTALFQGLPGWVGTRKAKKQKTIWILLKQETVSDSDISWAIYKSAPRSRQITTPAPHHSVFTGRLPFLPPNQQRQSTEGKPQTQVDGKKHKVAKMQHNVAFLHFKYPHIYQQIAKKKHTTKYSAILLKVNSTVQKMHSHMFFLIRITQKVSGRF